MVNSSVIEILRTFDKDELKKFDDFIRSPYFNKRNILKKLFSAIKKHAPLYNNEKLKKQFIWTKMFPAKRYNYGVMKNAIFDFQKLAETFLQIRAIEKNIPERSINILREFLNRNLNSLFAKELKHAREIINDSKSGSSLFKNKVACESLVINFVINKNLDYEKTVEYETLNMSILENFFFTFFKENYGAAFINNWRNNKSNKELISIVTRWFEEISTEVSDDVRIQFYSFKIAVDRNDVPAYRSLHELIYRNHGNFLIQEQFNLFLRLANFSREQVESGNKEFIPVAFQNYKFMIDNSLMLSNENEFIHHYFYLNSIDSSIAAKEFKWTLNFIEKYKPRLIDEVRENIYEKALISYYFAVKNFDKSNELMSKVKLESLLDKITVKRFQLKIKYELGDFDDLNLYIDSARHYISGDKMISEELKKYFLDFISILKKLAGFRENIKFNPENRTLKNALFDLSRFKTETLKKDVLDKIWLTEKFEELHNFIKS